MASVTVLDEYSCNGALPFSSISAQTTADLRNPPACARTALRGPATRP